MWVARNKYGELRIFARKPIRDSINSLDKNIWIDIDGFDDRITYGIIVINEKESFTNSLNISWEDEPIEVKLTVASETVGDEQPVDVKIKLD